ncbi:MAG TPA: FliM/FliN family flagellar motor C-terminal domain-containing protein [Methylomirabilota bacterium]|nr:FliM/FliN family flagellar motor C-terminal domain-containing protein [Methylomirabilota bacterium]
MSSAPAIPKQIPVAIPEEVWADIGELPCLLSVDLPLRKFTVRDLLQLEPGVVVETRNPEGSDVPVSVNRQLIAWAEFEVVSRKLAIRLTELA